MLAVVPPDAYLAVIVQPSDYAGDDSIPERQANSMSRQKHVGKTLSSHGICGKLAVGDMATSLVKTQAAPGIRVIGR